MIRRFVHWLSRSLVALVFVAGISTPGAVMLWRAEDPATAATENRVLAARPDWSWDWNAIRDFPTAFGKYFDDAFGLRPVLTRWHHLANFRVFGISPTNVVVVGKDEWLFLDHSMKMFRREAAFSDEQIATQARLLQERHDWLASRGIKYLVVLVPNKPEIYPDFVPADSHQLWPENHTDRLESYINSHCSFDVLNLRHALADASAEQLTYNPSDCHWNDFGAYVGYRAIVDRMQAHFPEMQPISREDSTIENRMATGDLMHIMGFPEITEPRVFMKPAHPRMVGERWTPIVGSTVVMTVDDARLPKAVVMHDSFMTAMYPFLAEHFRETTFRWIYGDFDPKAVIEHKPDIVIQELVERAMDRLNKNGPHIKAPPTPPTTPGQPRPQLAERPAGPGASTLK